MFADFKDHFGGDQEFECSIHGFLHQASLSVLMNIEAPVHEASEFPPGSGEPRGYEREYVGIKGIRLGNSGVDLLGRGLDIALEKLFYLPLVFRDKYRLPVRVQPWPSGPTRHLVVLACRDRLHSLPGGEAEIIPDNHPAGREVKPGSERRSRRDTFDQPFPESLLHHAPLLAAQTGMVKSRTAGYA